MDQSAALIFSGFVTVMIVLALLWGVCGTVGLGFRYTAKLMAARALKRAEPVIAPAANDARSALEEDLPAIVAAVGSVLDKPFRIVDVAVPAHQTIGWNQGASFVHMTGQRMPWDRITFINEGKRRSIKFW
tara:strand:- start:679 stop:1071 length:393 start_codon:yes stop_codon:yes gene_type:complete